MATVFTIDGHRPPKRKAKPRSGKRLELGECKLVPTGKKKNCQIELCRTGKGRTGYQFTPDSRRCGKR